MRSIARRMTGHPIARPVLLRRRGGEREAQTRALTQRATSLRAAERQPEHDDERNVNGSEGGKEAGGPTWDQPNRQFPVIHHHRGDAKEDVPPEQPAERRADSIARQPVDDPHADDERAGIARLHER